MAPSLGAGDGALLVELNRKGASELLHLDPAHPAAFLAEVSSRYAIPPSRLRLIRRGRTLDAATIAALAADSGKIKLSVVGEADVLAADPDKTLKGQARNAAAFGQRSGHGLLRALVWWFWNAPGFVWLLVRSLFVADAIKPNRYPDRRVAPPTAAEQQAQAQAQAQAEAEAARPQEGGEDSWVPATFRRAGEGARCIDEASGGDAERRFRGGGGGGGGAV